MTNIIYNKTFKGGIMLAKEKNFFSLFLAFLAIILTIAMILHPEATFQGANYGLKTWATILVPSLLPFFIIADILVELGVVSLLGVLLEPLMRPVFKQPGAAGFVMAMGFTSGFPMGAVLTNTLYEKNLCTKEEASRLIAFTNNSSPLFLLVAVPVGMFQNPNLGILLAVSHYGANILLGIILGLLKSEKRVKYFQTETGKSILKKSIRELFVTNQNKTLSFGALMGKAVQKAIHNMLTIGGFVIFFAVLIEIFRITEILSLLAVIFTKLLSIIGLDPQLGEALSTGFFEMTLGTKKASEISAGLREQAIIVSVILGWSGLSIQAQVSSIVAKNYIPIYYFLLGRIFQGIMAGIITMILFVPFLNFMPVINMYSPFTSPLNGWNYFVFHVTSCGILISIMLILSLLKYKIIKN